MTLAVGILGVGHLAGYLVEGFYRSSEDLALVLSPRNLERSRVLAERFGASIAEDNQGVVSAVDIVILSTRPSQALDAVRDLHWKKGQLLVSVAGGVTIGVLESVSRPATVVRAMPVSCAAMGESPTSVFPTQEGVEALFEKLGPVFPMPDEPSFDAASVVGAVYAWMYALLGEATEWMQSAGVPSDSARRLVAQATRGAAGMVLTQPDRAIEEMLAGLATSGGITERGLEVLRDSDALAAWGRACDAALGKIRASPGR